MARALELWANPSSPHGEGRAARKALEEARESLAASLGWRHDVIFTSEAVSIVAKRARLPGRAYGATEHDIVPASMGEQATVLPVGKVGLIDMTVLGEVLGGGPALIAIQQVNNETGVIQPIEAISAKVREAGSLLLADCAQSAGKMPLPDADFIAISAHKFGGPPGIGALLIRDLAALEASGGQEKGYRRGTQNLPGACGMAAALESRAFAQAMPKLAELRRRLDDLAGFAVSAGSACSSGAMKESRVLKAMQVDPTIASSCLRISFGPSTSEGDVDRFLAEWTRIAERAAQRAA